MIEVFKTNIEQLSQANEMISLLQSYFPESKINIDLHDCDKVLRIEGESFIPAHVINLVKEKGFICAVLE
jgi:hypothetical protein